MIAVEALVDEFPAIAVADVGAAIVDGGDPEPYEPLLRRGLATLVGFEPDTDACARLNDAGRGRFLPVVVADGSPKTFHECASPLCSSIFEPDEQLLELFQYIAPYMKKTGERPVETSRLDDVAGLGEVDFLKIDAQGAAYEVLGGAARVLSEAVAVHVEVEFVPLYRGQHLFRDVDRLLAERGFTFFRFASFSGRALKPIAYDDKVNTLGSQWLWGDAVYIRDFMTLETLSAPKLLKLAAVLHHCYLSHDTAAFVLAARDRLTGDDLSARFIEHLVEAD